MSKKPSIRRSATLELATTDSEEENYIGGLKRTGSKRKSSSLNRSGTSSISFIPKKLTKADQTILTDSSGKTLPPRKSTSIYSKYSIAKSASNASLKSKKSNASITSKASLKGKKPKGGKAVKKKAPVKKTAKKSAAKGKKAKPAAKPKREIHYLRAEFIALKADDADFYLAQVCQHVYEDTEIFRIRWLEESVRANKVDGEYRISYVDETEPECIITHVRMIRVRRDKWDDNEYYRLPDSEQRKILRRLNSEEDSSEEEEEDEEEEEEEEATEDSDDEPPAKKKKGAAKGRKKKVVSTKAKKTAKPKKAEKPKKRKLTAEERANPNLLLKKNDKVKVLDKDPFLEGKDKVPFVSNNAQAKLVHRAVALRDVKLLKSLVADLNNIYSVSPRYSVAYDKTPLDLAIRNNDVESIKVLLKETAVDSPNRKKQRVGWTQSLLSTTGTGNYNYRSLGVPRIQKLTMSRGCKEGNNALLKDSDLVNDQDIQNALLEAVKQGVPKSTFDAIVNVEPKKDDRDYSHMCYIYQYIVDAVKNGHRKLAGYLVDRCIKSGGGFFNFLHRDVLLFNNEDLKSFREASAKKKPWDNEGMTPIHCAAINPNVKYLSKLLTVLPEYNVLDRRNGRPIHYAAACEGPGPMEYLLKRGVDPEEVNGQGQTALMIACQTGRTHNVKLLLDKAKEEFENSQQNDDSDKGSDEEEDEDDEGNENDARQANINKFGIGGINRPVQKPGAYYALAPLHFAIMNDRVKVVEELIRHGVDLHKTLHNAKNKETPLMIACYHGNLDMVKLLVKNKARVEEKDRLKRTALIHACMNGRAKIASYLLNLGADPDAADSSGNTCTHYAAAYGWYHCVKLLLEAGADANKANEWKITPMWIAFLKGHLGLMDILLDQPNADVNVQDEEGMTLLANACASPLVAGLDKQIKYLVEKRGADPNIPDEKGNNCLHHLAENKVQLADEKSNEEAAKLSESLTNYLIGKGCSPASVNKDGASPLFIAIWKDNMKMVKILINHTTVLPTTQDKNGNNLLHNMAFSCLTSNQKAILDLLLGQASFHAQLKKMAKDVNDAGYTPVLSACHVYHTMTPKDLTTVVNSNNPSEELDEEEENESYDEDEDEDERKEREERERRRKAKAKGTSMESSEDASLEWTREQQRMKEARDFIDALIVRCGSDVSQAVQKPTVKTDKDTSNYKEWDFYSVPQNAGWTPLFYMIAPKAEDPTKRKDGSAVDMTPGLTMILKHGPDVNEIDLHLRSPLVWAVTQADANSAAIAAAVKMLVEKGANMDYQVVIPDELKEYLLDKLKLGCSINMAASAGNVEATIYLADQGADLAIFTKEGKDSVLHHAVQHRRAECNMLPMVKTLVEKGADINHTNSQKSTPLHVALDFSSEGSDGTAEVESCLIDYGAAVHLKDMFGRIPLHKVFAKVGRAFNTTRDDPIDLCTTLVSVMRPDNINEKDNYGATALHYAARRGAGVCCMTLIQKGAEVNIKDGDGNTPLALAALSDHESCTILLLQRKADFSQQAISGKELLDRSAKEAKTATKTAGKKDKDEIPALRWILMREQEERERKLEEVSTFQVCVQREWQGVVFMMLNELDKFNFSPAEAVQAALNVNKYNLALTFLRKIKEKKKFAALLANSRTLFHVFSLKADPTQQEELQFRLAEKLSEVGVPLNRKDRYGCLPLHYACLNRNATLVKFILGKVPASNISERDNNRRTPLIAAIFGESSLPEKKGVSARMRETVGELLKNGAKLDDHKFAFDPPEYCQFGFRPKDAKKILETEYCKPSLNEVTSIILSISFENFHLTKYLLQNKADINGADKYGKTAMMYAVLSNDHHFVRLLLDVKYCREETEKDDNEEDEDDEEDEEEEEEEEEEEDDQGSDYDPESDDSDASPKKRKAKQKAIRAKIAKKLSRRVFDMGGSESDDEDGDEDVSAAKKKKQKRGAKPKGGLAFWKDFIFTKKTSRVGLNATDSSGRTALHHLKGPLRLGSFENVDILKLLVDNGADINKRDNDSFLPIECYIADGAAKLHKAMKSFMSGGARYPSPTYEYEDISDNIKWSSGKPNFRDDAVAMLKKVDDQKKDETKEKERKLKVDPKLDVKDGEVAVDTDQEIPYDVLLMKIDVTKGRYCMYNFYKLQLVFDKKKKLYVMLNRWGRIGDEGQFQQTPFATLEEASKEFAKIFKSKTGNKWTDVKSFEFHKGKYRLIPVEQRLRKEREYNAIDFDLSSNKSSEMPAAVTDLMKEISNLDGLNGALLKAHFNVQSTPIGRISQEFLDKATKILDELEPLNEKWRVMHNLPDADERDEYHESAQRISELTNEYYYLVPSGEFSYEKVAPIVEENGFYEARMRVKNLEELELAGRLLAAAQFRKREINPMDYIYRSLNCQLRSLEEGDAMAQYLLQYIHASYPQGDPDFAVERIFEVSRAGELERYKGCKMDNQKLLFHGTKSSNLMGILSRGLLVTPLEAWWCGRSYGNGVYFSDSFAKSFAYSHNFNNKSNKRFVLICQVKLGNLQTCDKSGVDYIAKKPDSLWAQGMQSPEAKYDVTLPNGVVVPLGRVEHPSASGGYVYRYGGNTHSEFIIPREEQVLIKYLVQLRSVN